MTSAVAAETTVDGQRTPLAVQPLDPKGRQIRLSARALATLTRPGFGQSGLTLLTWRTAPSRRMTVAGRGVSEDELVRFAQTILRPDGGIKVDRSAAPVGMSLLYDGPDLAGEPQGGRSLVVIGGNKMIQISTSPTKFSPLAGLWLQPQSRLVQIRGHMGLLRTGEQLSFLSWAETDGLAVSVLVQNRLSRDLLSIASRLRVVDAARWKAYLHRTDAKPPQSGSATTTTAPVPPTITSAVDPRAVTGVMELVGGPAGTKPIRAPGTVSAINEHGDLIAEVKTNSNGRFAIGLPHGTYQFTGSSPKYGNGRGECRSNRKIDVNHDSISGIIVACEMR